MIGFLKVFKLRCQYVSLLVRHASLHMIYELQIPCSVFMLISPRSERDSP